MNRIPEKTRDKIIAAAEALLLEGINKPTNDQVRERMGGGSLSHISPVMRDWREKRQRENSAVPQMPTTLKQALERTTSQIWSLASKEAEDRFAGQRAELEEATQQSAQERDEALREVEKLEGILDTKAKEAERKEETIRDLSTENSALKAEGEKLTASLLAKEEIIAVLKADLQSRTTETARLQAELIELAKASGTRSGTKGTTKARS